jgi:hypothetical protein
MHFTLTARRNLETSRSFAQPRQRLIAKTFRFEDVVKAYQYLESNQQIGKVVLTVGA